MALNKNLIHAVMKTLGDVANSVYVGDIEGQVDFYTAAGPHYVDTIQKAGANGTSDDTVTIIATWVATGDTTVSSVHLYGTRGNRDPATRQKFSSNVVSESMLKGDAFTVQWVLTAAI